MDNVYVASGMRMLMLVFTLGQRIILSIPLWTSLILFSCLHVHGDGPWWQQELGGHRRTQAGNRQAFKAFQFVSNVTLQLCTASQILDSLGPRCLVEAPLPAVTVGSSQALHSWVGGYQVLLCRSSVGSNDNGWWTGVLQLLSVVFYWGEASVWTSECWTVMTARTSWNLFPSVDRVSESQPEWAFVVCSYFVCFTFRCLLADAIIQLCPKTNCVVILNNTFHAKSVVTFSMLCV